MVNQIDEEKIKIAFNRLKIIYETNKTWIYLIIGLYIFMSLFMGLRVPFADSFIKLLVIGLILFFILKGNKVNSQDFIINLIKDLGNLNKNVFDLNLNENSNNTTNTPSNYPKEYLDIFKNIEFTLRGEKNPSVIAMQIYNFKMSYNLQKIDIIFEMLRNKINQNSSDFPVNFCDLVEKEYKKIGK